VSEEIRRVEPEDPEVTEEWVRETEDPDELRDLEVYATSDSAGWVVYVPAQGVFPGEDALGVELRQRLQRALRAVPGVTGVEEYGTEEWEISGTAAGDALIRGAANVLDEMAARLRAWLIPPGAS
jgi:chorismate synthase